MKKKIHIKKIYILTAKDSSVRVRKIYIKDLSITHLSDTFLKKNISVFTKVFVKCDQRGELLLSGNPPVYDVMMVKNREVERVEYYPPQKKSFIQKIQSVIKIF